MLKQFCKTQTMPSARWHCSGGSTLTTWAWRGLLLRQVIAFCLLLFLADSIGSTAVIAAENKYQKPDSLRGYQQGVALYRRGQYWEAYRLLRQLANRQPENSLCHLYLGRCCLRIASCDIAISELNLAREQNPILLNDTAVELGEAYLNKSRFDEALLWCAYCKKYISTPIPQLEKIEHQAKHLATFGDAHRSNYLTDKDDSRWPSSMMPLRVRIASGSSCQRRQSIFANFVRHSLNAWSVASNGAVTFRIVRNGPEDILFRLSEARVFVSGKRVGGRTNLQQIGCCLSGTIPKFVPNIRHASIVIGAPDDRDFVLQVVLHETGHALGICSHSNNYFDAMREGPMAAWCLSELSKRDSDAIQTMYSSRVAE